MLDAARRIEQDSEQKQCSLSEEKYCANLVVWFVSRSAHHKKQVGCKSSVLASQFQDEMSPPEEVPQTEKRKCKEK
eukprot:141998-Amphidinium_carterae.1